MSKKRQVNRKNLRVIDGEKAARATETQSAKPSGGLKEADIAAALFFWPIDVMRWWMPQSTGRAEA